MKLIKITINDLGVYRGRNEFNLRTEQNKPIILCGGTNGSGKTTFFESVMLCLYGQDSFEKKISQKQYHETILRLIHRYLGTKKAADEASIIVEFQFAHEGDVLEYQVRRMWQNNDGKVDEKLTIKKKKPDDEKFEKIDVVEESEWQTFIEHLIPRGIAKLFFFDGEKIQNIADEGGEETYIKSSFDVLLGLDLVQQLNNDIGLTLLRNSEGETKKILEEIDLRTKEKEECEKKIKKHIETISTLKQDISNLQKKNQIQKEQFMKIGGQFASKREELTKNQGKLEYKLEEIEKEIKTLCGTTLPFSLIPEQLKEVKKEIMLDQKRIQSSFQKDILEKNFDDLHAKITAKKFLPDVDDSIKEEFVNEVRYILQEKIDSIPKTTKTRFNFSGKDMEKISKFIEGVNELGTKKIEALAKSFNIITNALEQTKVGLDSAPKQDEAGPIFGEMTKTSREIGELENELENITTLLSQEKSLLVLLNSKIRRSLTQKIADKRRLAGLELGPKVQKVLDEYSQLLRIKKLELLEHYILDSLKMLLHKENFIEKVSIDKETFEVKIYKGNDDEITKDMLSKGELQMFATAVVWGLAKTSGRSLPFMIDTPLARLDEEHRTSLVEYFYPKASHQTIILSTDSEIDYSRYQKLKSYISKSFVIQYNSKEGKTIKHDKYFFNDEGEKLIEI